ncbi:deoxyribonuclease-2-beta isoform X1 [Xenopus tropicalis]|uniref:deoxyribonuclease II n=1 Tax=Xenopus tropicalis TaxID=8364 RepID=A0A8J1JDF0_XENTR|nr:deoxyribonuclease-2-beta isoform X1 [Xenopus tropicalis]
MFGLYQFAVLYLIAMSMVAAEISCRNEAGDPIDWFVVYKLPMLKMNGSTGSGLDYLYMDSTNQEWQISKFQINTTKSAVGQVLQQLYQDYDKNNTVYMIYNDAPPNVTNSTRKGHTKATQLLYYNPNVYNCSVPDIYQKEMWMLHKICLGGHFPWIDSTRLTQLNSARGEVFLNFAKSKYFIDDIFAAWIAQKLRTNMLVESWQSRQQLSSNCSLQYHVYNINRIGLPTQSTFQTFYDHSKWCVSQSNEDLWTCIGDLNRHPAQTRRSGGFICTQNKHIYTAFRNMVLYYKNCTDTEYKI